MPIDYQNGMIYKIVALNCEDPEQVYFGSTTQGLAKRMGSHKGNYKRWKEGKGNLITSFILFETYGIENCKIILLETYPCNSKYELQAKEAEYILNSKCVNKCIPNRSNQQWRFDNEEHLKEQLKIYRLTKKDYFKAYGEEYRNINADYFKEYNNQYYIENLDKFKEINKKYREDNADEIKIYKKEYRKTNIDKMKEHANKTFLCECGIHYTYSNKTRHFKSIRHKSFIEENPESILS